MIVTPLKHDKAVKIPALLPELFLLKKLYVFKVSFEKQEKSQGIVTSTWILLVKLLAYCWLPIKYTWSVAIIIINPS